ncbi:MAG: phosphatidate cytidylyltransferase [Ferruginibacter sp.]
MNRLKLITQLSLLIVLTTTLLSSCQAIGDIFKAGVWVGVLIVVGIIGLILYLVGRGKK